jgi:hypothetical protein
VLHVFVELIAIIDVIEGHDMTQKLVEVGGGVLEIFKKYCGNGTNPYHVLTSHVSGGGPQALAPEGL